MSGRVGGDGDEWGRPLEHIPEPEPPPPPPAAAPSSSHSDSLPASAAMATVVGAFGLLLAALVTALTIEVGRRQGVDDAWKIRLKIAALTSVVGPGSGSGPTVGLALLVALGLVRSAAVSRGAAAVFVGAGACLASLWLGVATAVDIYVNLSSGSPVTYAGGKGGAVITDVATLVILAAAGAWGAATATGSR